MTEKNRSLSYFDILNLKFHYFIFIPLIRIIIILYYSIIFIILLIFLGAIFSSGSGDQQTEILDGSILSLDLEGYLVEEKTQSEFEAAFA